MHAGQRSALGMGTSEGQTRYGMDAMPAGAFAVPPSTREGGGSTRWLPWSKSGKDVGEAVILAPSNYPGNKWNSAANPFRNYFFKLFLTVPVLYQLALLIMIMIESFQKDINPGNLNFMFSSFVWWILIMTNMIASACAAVAAAFLERMKKAMKDKAEQDYPPPPQDFKLFLVSFLFNAASYAIYQFYYSSTGFSSLDQRQYFFAQAIFLALGAWTVLRDVVMLMASKMEMPDNIQRPMPVAASGY